MAIVVMVAAVIAFIVWFAKRNQVTTDDAYTDGNTVPMAPKVSGYVVDLNIDDNTHVHWGDLLLRIEQDVTWPRRQRTARRLPRRTRNSMRRESLIKSPVCNIPHN